jgi:hypothetical protein
MLTRPGELRISSVQSSVDAAAGARMLGLKSAHFIAVDLSRRWSLRQPLGSRCLEET